MYSNNKYATNIMINLLEMVYTSSITNQLQGEDKAI